MVLSQDMPMCRYSKAVNWYAPYCGRMALTTLNPVINTWYPIATLNDAGCINKITVYQLDNLLANNTIEYRVTLDTLVHTGIQVAAHNTLYHVYTNPTIANDLNLGFSLTMLNFGGYIFKWYDLGTLAYRVTTAPTNPSTLYTYIDISPWLLQ